MTDQPTGRRFFIGKVGISAVTMADCLRLIEDRVRAGQPAYICVANLKTTVISQKDETLCRIQNESFLTTPDGMPLVWYAAMTGVRGVERVTGPDLMMNILKGSGEKGFTHYFCGDTKETLAGMIAEIHDHYPGVTVKGVCSPPFRSLTDAEMNEMLEEINRLKPTFVWVGLGAPKQEKWMAEAIGRIDSSILIGVGAAFRFLIGEYQHPPLVLQKAGLEGVWWRFRKVPVSRQLVWYSYHLPVFGCLLIRGMAKRLMTRRPD